MKPKEKSVTAQDVQSSLYYVHVHGVEDQELMNFEEPDDGQPTEHEPPLVAPLSSKSSVRRKPLPPTSNTALLNQPEPPLAPQVQSPPSTDGLQNVRKPVGRGGTAHDNLDNAPPLPDRRLHGPRPMNQNLHSVYGAALQDVSARMNVDMRRWSEQPALVAPKLPPRPDSTYTLKLPHATQNGALTTTKHKHRAEQSPSERTAEHCWDWEKRWEQKRLSGDMVRRTSSQYALFNNGGVFQNCSLTLIRRYNGEQWNAAKILTGANGAFPNDPGLVGVDINIEVLTAAYSKFCERTTSHSPNGKINTEGSHEIPSAIGQGNRTSSDHGGKTPSFRRCLQHDGHQRTWNEGRRSESDDGSLTKEARSTFDFRRHSYQRWNRFEPTGSSEHKPASQRAYNFESPWNGLCTFSTGIAGRSLKCNHSHSRNSTISGPGTQSSAVSELRFNLPSSKALGTPTSKISMPGKPRESKRSSIFSRHQSRGSSTASGVNESIENEYSGSEVQLEDRLDLSLGQEHAGGGFGGKQAKLGKLIIENEGLQMLDLIVAANMALYWKIYEKLT